MKLKKKNVQTGPEKTVSTDLFGIMFKKFFRSKHNGIPLEKIM